MPHSDTQHPDDALVGEVARQLADSAPPVPSWDRITGADVHNRTGGAPAAWPRIVLAAAAVAAIAWGLFVVARADDEIELPADVPIETIAPVDTFAGWLEEASTLDAQLCFTRSVDSLSGEHADGLVSQTNARPDLIEPVALRISLARQTVRPLAALLDHPGTPRVVADDLRPVVAAFDDAEAGQYAPDGSPSPEAVPLEADAAAARRSSDSLAPAPADCWLERAVGGERLASFVRSEGALAAVRCISLTQFDVAAANLEDDPDGFRLAVETGRVLSRWYDPTPDQLVEFDRAIVTAEFARQEDRSIALAAARDDLAPAALELDACTDLFPQPARRRDPSTTTPLP